AIADLKLGDATKNIVSETGACGGLGSAAAFAASIMLDPRAMFPKPPPKPPAPPPGGEVEPLDSTSPRASPWWADRPMPEPDASYGPRPFSCWPSGPGRA